MTDACGVLGEPASHFLQSYKLRTGSGIPLFAIETSAHNTQGGFGSAGEEIGNELWVLCQFNSELLWHFNLKAKLPSLLVAGRKTARLFSWRHSRVFTSDIQLNILRFPLIFPYHRLSQVTITQPSENKPY